MIIKDHFDKLSRLAIGFLGLGVVLVVFAAFQMGPKADAGSPLTWSSFGLGSLALVSSLVLYNVAVALQDASWVNVGIFALIGIVLIGISVLWLRAMGDGPVFFHPALVPRLLGALWFLAAIVNAFRAGNR
ncbi:hypothetical protein [Corynebacterium sp. A21]|uniref:hypothetical protein n=1 Tax=Corynebacterium sp. A21 TaxID=3457318 RepID=UPI003FD599DD